MEEILKKLFVKSNANFFIQFIRYAVVGGAATVVDFTLYHFEISTLNINHIIANTISFTMGLLINYFLSISWVFNKQKHNFTKDFMIFAIIGLLGLIFSNLILFILIDTKLLYKIFIYSSDKFVKDIAKLTATFIVLFWNFIARRKIVSNDI